MQELLIAVARGLVEDKDAVQVTVDPAREDGTVVYHLTVAEGDMGRVIGKQGRIAKAIRVVMRAAAVRQNENPLFLQFPLLVTFAVPPYFSHDLPCVGHIGSESKEINSVPQWENICLVVQFQSQPGHVLFNLPAAILQIRLVLVNQVKVVHIPPIIADSQFLFYEVVKPRKVHDREPL